MTDVTEQSLEMLKYKYILYITLSLLYVRWSYMFHAPKLNVITIKILDLRATNYLVLIYNITFC